MCVYISKSVTGFEKLIYWLMQIDMQINDGYNMITVGNEKD